MAQENIDVVPKERRPEGTLGSAAGRLLAGAIMALCGLIGLRASLLGILLTGAGAFTALTGAIGYCPSCAIAGRKLPADQ
jgi:uncharacterized membrane protein